MPYRMLVALGGNALVRSNQFGFIHEQFENVNSALNDIVRLITEGHRLIITHGNGFQVGNIMLRSELAAEQAYPLPLDVADAQSQGEIGYVIQQCLQNKLTECGCERQVATIITQIVVDPGDPAFANPTKPIGRYYTYQEMLARRKGGEHWVEQDNRGWRKVVSSPEPKDIVEKEIIRRLFDAGYVVITCGGGGIPVVRENGLLRGIEAVIDKDLASALLATLMDIEIFVILTGVEQVYLNYDKLWKSPLSKMTLSEAKKYLKQGHFPPGSMGPKIQAAIRYLEHRAGGDVIITSLDNLYSAIGGKGGTHICIS